MPGCSNACLNEGMMATNAREARHATHCRGNPASDVIVDVVMRPVPEAWVAVAR